MTINEAIELVDELRPNQYTRDIKIAWLSTLDGRIYNEVFCTHEGNQVASMPRYTEESGEVELLIPYPYAEDIYNYFLQAMIDKENGEATRYNQSITMYNSAFRAFANAYNRTHMPLSAGSCFMI